MTKIATLSTKMHQLTLNQFGGKLVQWGKYEAEHAYDAAGVMSYTCLFLLQT